MRRSDFLHTDDELFQEVARHCQVGYLGLVTAEGFPRSVALNFVAIGKNIYFHGALAGEKFGIITGGVKAGFTMARELSYIPSNWTGPRYACPATQLYKSVEIKGRCVEVEDLSEKAGALQALMKKHQPEDSFVGITADEKIYRKALRQTGVFRVDVESWTGKVRLFQEKPTAFRKKIMEKLEQRGLPGDRETLEEMGEA
jgi:uncharacterized protein